MRLELLIPTLRRPALVRAAVLSIGRAARPQTLDVSVTIINNDTVPLPLEPWTAGPFPLRVIEEPQPGKSAALNTGIAASAADYIGLLDDDAEVAEDWFLVVERILQAGGVDFIGGRAVLRHLTEQPSWVPPGYPAVLGGADAGPVPFTYGPSFPGILMGVNAVISRAVLLAIGPYSTALGPRVDRRLGSCEDEDMYWRLIRCGARGLYVPDLVVYHHVHPERLRKAYFRSWCFWNGASKGVMGRRRPLPAPHIAGVPRYVYGEAFRGLLTWLRSMLPRGSAAQRTAGELPAWHLAGRLYGRYFLRDEPGGTSPTARGDVTPPRPYGDDAPAHD
jgi:glycosyltransferase involved in cell wall biosynthesis